MDQHRPEQLLLDTLRYCKRKSRLLLHAEGHTADHVWRVPGVAPTSLDGQLAVQQPYRLPAKSSAAHHARRRSTAPARSRRQDTNQEPSRDSSQERAAHKAEVRAAKRAAKQEALEREWKVQQVAGELGHQADLLERHRYLVAKYGGPHALGHLDVGSHARGFCC